jgi:hypothetical protein
MATKSATVFTWNIAQLEREVSDGYVFTAHYTIDAKNDAYTSGAYGSIGFERPENLIPYSELSKEEVVQWVKEVLGEEKVVEIEAALQQQLDEQRTPSKASGLPWSN